jgi:nucleotide-binding universal stress UspA family protein
MSTEQTCPVPGLARLLVATERSAFSEGAVREAINLAKKCSSTLCVMTVVETNPEYETMGAELLQKEEEEAVQYLRSIKTRASEERISCEVSLQRGSSASHLIVEEAIKKKSDMILIGRRGRRGLEKLLMGSAAARVIGHATCKVLVVPKAARILFKNILVATDGSEYADRAVGEAIEIARQWGSRLIALSVFSAKNEEKKAQENVGGVVSVAKKAGVTVEAITATGRPCDLIAETAGGRGVDLIVMGTYGRTGLKKLLMGSTTEKVIGMAGCAVLVVK